MKFVQIIGEMCVRTIFLLFYISRPFLPLFLQSAPLFPSHGSNDSDGS